MGRELYRERTGWPWWVHVVVLAASAGALLGPFLARDSSTVEPAAWGWILAGNALFVFLLYWFLGGLTVVVEPHRIRVGLGHGWPVGTTIELDQIEELESVEYRPLREFGGWGVRGRAERRIWSARGNQAVRLTMADGRVIYIGSDEPRNLENRIRQAMAT